MRFGLKEKQEKVCAIIPAAGSSTRMGTNKLMISLGEMPVLVRTVLAFQTCEVIDEIILVCREWDIVPYGKLMQNYEMTKVTQVVRGGETRAQSVLAGICACSPEVGWVAVHDGARPFVSDEIIRTTTAAAKQYGAAAPVVPMKDSIKRVRNGVILADVARNTLAAVQTPQIFKRDMLRQALEEQLQAGCAPTDDCAAVETLGISVHTVAGSYENIKITTPEDVVIGEAILRKQEES